MSHPQKPRKTLDFGASALPEWVMDILLFTTMTAEESLALAMGKGWQFYPALHPYLASFCAAPEAALEVLRQFEI